MKNDDYTLGFAEGHQMGYEAGLKATQPPTDAEEIARVRLPIAVTSLASLVDGLTEYYGENNLLMSQRGEWLVFVKTASPATPEPPPTEPDPEDPDW